MPDPDYEISGGGGEGGGGGGHPDPEIKGVVSKTFFGPSGFSLV